MIRIAGINENDFVNGKGVSVSLFLQGCPFRCKGCHNPETWNPDGGEIWDWNELINHILELITANGIQRNLSILGGEPLDTYDKRDFIRLLIKVVKSRFPDIKICIWTGYTYDQLIEIVDAGEILANIDYLIDTFRDAKEIGSLLKVEKRDYSYATEKLNEHCGLTLS